MQCPHFDASRCRSCALMGRPYPAQVEDKEQACRALLADVGGERAQWLPAFTGPESGFRNKAKMVVSGTVDAPVLGILDHGGAGVDLTDCGLYPAALQAAFGPLAAFVTRAALTPYDVTARRGELKYLIVTRSPAGELMVRFVCRSQEPVARIRKHLPWLAGALPGLAVASVNVQPEHKAILEGDLEIVLTERETLTMRVGSGDDARDLHLRPQSFFQTNTLVAEALYAQASAWVDEVAPATVWDLYCGVGGFALHCAAPGRTVVGVETSRDAVASAALTARDAGLPGLRFVADDATAFALGAPARDVPDLVIVNPPRRGIGVELAGWLEASGVRDVVYSSCNAVTLAKDLAAMPSLRVRRARLLDMFPQTHHYEVVTLLSRA